MTARSPGPTPTRRAAARAAATRCCRARSRRSTTAFTGYVRDELGFRTDLPYRLLAEAPGHNWQWHGGAQQQGYVGAADDVREARGLNPRLRVLIAHGYTDLVTPYLASRYLIDQMPPMPGTPPVELKLYGGGHMMYMHAASRAALAVDAAALFAASVE